MTIIEPFRPEDVPHFLNLAEKEGWICDAWEFDFLLHNFPQGCWAATGDRLPIGFVTTLKHEKSGWIGNLLLQEESRSRGFGKLLLKEALSSLDYAGVDTVWLTASPAGLPLYESLGFCAIDRIVRWRGSGGCGNGRLVSSLSFAAMEEMDHSGWGDLRSELLGAVMKRGIVLSETAGFCVLQVTSNGLQLGPWGCHCLDDAEALLLQALVAAGPRPARIFIDVPEANGVAADILERHGFSPCGVTTLMYRGKFPNYNPERIFGLASMGSMG